MYNASMTNAFFETSVELVSVVVVVVSVVMHAVAL